MGLKSKAKFLVRQFPFIVPSVIIPSCKDWIDKQKKHKGVYFSQRGPWYKTIFPTAHFHHNKPQTMGLPNEKAFYSNSDYNVTEANLFYLPNSYLLGHKGLILTANHQVFQEFTHNFNISTLKRFLWKNPFYTFSKSWKKINGIGAVLISPESHNYYHWLSDVLPRIKLYEPVLDKIDIFCVSSNVPANFLEILPDFGIAKDKLIFVDKKEKLHFDHLYVASLPGSEGRSPQWAIDYIREKLVKSTEDEKSQKKIYFKRNVGAERNILNEDAIITILKTNGFEIIDPGVLTIQQQVNLMQQAKIIISAHGAALSNLLFSNDDMIVIELFSPDYFRTDCYYTLSSIRKLNYWYIAGSKPYGANWGDIIVPAEVLIKTLQKINP